MRRISEEEGKVLDIFSKELENVQIRYWIRKKLESQNKRYDRNECYIIFDKERVEIYNRDIFSLKQIFGKFKSHFISRPIRMI